MAERIRIGIIGMGGFAGEHHKVFDALENEGTCRLVCTCDPDLPRWDKNILDRRFSERGIAFYSDYREMLASHAGELDLVTIPTPVPLHAPMHQACIDHGIPCYLEKPPTLNPKELRVMLAAEEKVVKQTQVGFNFIIEPLRQEWKTRLLAGEFGKLQSVRFLGLWPRSTDYFARASWAGRLRVDGKLTLDSCIGNAMAHYIHNTLFWAGQRELLSWASIPDLTAQMYRAHEIEGMDTVFINGQTESGIDIHVAATHACDGRARQREEVICEKAAITYIVGDSASIQWNTGEVEKVSLSYGQPLRDNLLQELDYLSGVASRPLTTLIDSRPFVEFQALAYVAAGQITTLPRAALNITPEKPNSNSVYCSIPEIASVCETFLSTGTFPDAQGASWGQAGGTATLAQLDTLDDIITGMQVQSPLPP